MKNFQLDHYKSELKSTQGAYSYAAIAASNAVEAWEKKEFLQVKELLWNKCSFLREQIRVIELNQNWH